MGRCCCSLCGRRSQAEAEAAAALQALGRKRHGLPVLLPSARGRRSLQQTDRHPLKESTRRGLFSTARAETV
eukprot:161244-Rhodomonas_salina.1